MQETQHTGFFVVQQTCRRCGGAGSVVTEHCSSCSGRGVVRQRKSVHVDIPAGIDDSMSLRVAGEGNAAELGPPGNLIVRVKVRPRVAAGPAPLACAKAARPRLRRCAPAGAAERGFQA